MNILCISYSRAFIKSMDKVRVCDHDNSPLFFNEFDSFTNDFVVLFKLFFFLLRNAKRR